MTTHRLGRNRPIAHGPRLRLSRYLHAAVLPAAPASVDYTPAAHAALVQMYKNDQLGDCVPAAMAHLVGLFTGNAGGPPVLYTDQQVVALYSAIGGYVPGNPNTDQGCDEVTALNYWTQHGAPAGSHQVAGWLAVDPTNVAEVKAALWLFENLFFGIELPDTWTQIQSSGFVWDVGTPNPSNGHCVCGVGFNAAGIQVSTWGMIGTLTWAALARNVGLHSSGGELYVVLSQDSIAKATAKAPSGMSWTQLVADFAAIGGHVPAPPAPAPAPPAPTHSPTKDQVLATISTALNGLTWR